MTQNRKKKKKSNIKEEIKNFCNGIQNEIVNNEFIQNTIHPIVGYLIHRYFCPTTYFWDPSFFDFDKTAKANERELKAEFFTGFKTLQFTDQDLELFKSKVNNKRKIKNFREEEFIVLRSIMATDKASFYLLIASNLKKYWDAIHELLALLNITAKEGWFSNIRHRLRFNLKYQLNKTVQIFLIWILLRL